MAVVIRLQRLKNTAGSEDIRKFFSGLKIPDGGVHIIGGEREEAFIIFASDEDARRAMTRSGGCIKGSSVDLLLSSRSEMQSILEESTKKLEMNQVRQHKEGVRRHEMGTKPPTKNMENRGPRYPEMGNGLVRDPRGEMNPKPESDVTFDVYVRLKGMPFSVTEEGVCEFFQGLQIDDLLLMKNHRGQNNGSGFVKFRTRRDASEGLNRDREYIGARFVEVYQSSEAQWLQAQGEMAAAGYGNNPNFRRGPAPAYTQRQQQDRGRSRSPVAYRAKSPSPTNKEFCVLLENLPYSVQKRDIKELFKHARLQEDQILYLLDGEGKRTRSLFVLFRSQRDYSSALTCHKQEFHNRCLYISSITKEKMISILEASQHTTEEAPERYSRSQERPLPQSDPYDSERVCLYVRNLPFDVRKVEIMDFFLGFSLSEDSVILLRDGKGAGLGEALVVFQAEVEAMTAQSLNGQRFLGSEVMLKCISRSQMREFGVAEPAVKVMTPRERGPQRFSARNAEASRHPRDMGYSGFRDGSEDRTLSLTDLQVHIHGGSNLDSNRERPYGPRDGGNGSLHGGFAPAPVQFDGPTCLKLVNLPLQITIDEIYDFCYGYRVIPGSVSLQYNKHGVPKGSATVVFESRREALTAVEELSGRPIGTKKIKLVFI